MRRYTLRAVPTVLCLLLTVLLPGCRKREQPAAAVPMEPTFAPATPVAVVTLTEVQLGKALGPDKRVATVAEIFAPKDTIFASVATDGNAPASVIKVKWIYQDGQTVKEDSRTIVATGPAMTEFSIQKPSGWPKGDYRVEVAVDGGPVTTKTFKVQ